MFSTLKVKTHQTFLWGLPDKSSGSTQNHKITAETPNQLIKSKNSQKKVCSVPQK
jgi:hypothetical protein